jgi:hypothetical protein
MKYLLIGCIAVIALYVLDKLGLWAERQGWMYYRHKPPTRTSIGNAMLELQRIFDPSKQYVVEERKKIKKEEKDSGDKPQAG